MNVFYLLGNIMKIILLNFIAFSFSVINLFGSDKVKEFKGTEDLRKQCYAYQFYLFGISETEYEARLDWFKKAIKLNSNLACAYYNRGTLYASHDDFKNGADDLKKTLELDDSYTYAYYNLACIESLESRQEEAIANLEKAMIKGYQKFDKILNDPDFKNIINNPKLLPLIEKYKTLANTMVLSDQQKFQVSDFDARMSLLNQAILKPNKQMVGLALCAMREANYEVRVQGMWLLGKLDVEEAKVPLLLGLYDTNGYVSKAASNVLIAFGKEIEPMMLWVLEDTESGAPFYAMQILARIGATHAIEKIQTFLKDKNINTQMTAADCLAQLKAVSAIPQIESALANLPNDKNKEFYAKSIQNSIDALKFIQKQNDK